MRRRLLRALVLSILVAPAAEPALAQQTVDQMSCAAAQASVARSQRYYKRTPMGVLPIFPAFSTNGPERCAVDEQRTYYSEVTRDSRNCPVGYACQNIYEYWGGR
jgi:hypothetical protein